MPPRLQPIARLLPLRQQPSLLARRLYSIKTSSSSEAPLIQVTDLPSPSSGHIRILELNRPSARNAISKALLSALKKEIDDVASQYGPNGEEIPGAVASAQGPTRALVVASAVETCFCAGADLKERRGFSQEEYVPPFPLYALSDHC